VVHQSYITIEKIDWWTSFKILFYLLLEYKIKMNWTTDIEKILENIRINSVNSSQQHKSRYFWFKKISTYFRIPTIVIASFVSVISVGLQNYTAQDHISSLTCLLSLVVGIINSIELYLKLQDNIELELEKSKQFYELASDIFKILNLDVPNRKDDGQKILNEYYSRYIQLYNESNLMKNNYNDTLLNLPKKKGLFSLPPSTKSKSSSSSSSSCSSESPLPRLNVFEEQI
jgi:hypothetical protein